ncbi:MAG: hypothetical protein AAFQ22_04795 [Pseudomonadota bacterium]
MGACRCGFCRSDGLSVLRLARGSVRADQRFFWENLDFHVAIIRAKPGHVEVFNAAMEALDDPFQFYPFVADDTP